MLKIKHLQKGDKVAIVSLSSGMLGEDFCNHTLEIGTARLEALGLVPVFMENSLKGIEYVKNNPDKRAYDLKAAFLDDDIKAVICAIGGNDTFLTLAHLLDDQEFIEAVENNPKIFLGYSDSTTNHFMFNKLGLPTFYGQSFVTDIAELDTNMLEYSEKAFKRLFDEEFVNNINSSPVWYEERKQFGSDQVGISRIKHGEARGHEYINWRNDIEGIVFGGCLESIYEMLKPTQGNIQEEIFDKYNLYPDLEYWNNKILFLETSEEKPNPETFENMIKAIDDTGTLKVIQALIFAKPQDEVFYEEYKSILSKYANKYNLPVILNINIGHSYPKTILKLNHKIKL
ncbi:S66 family peptidase [[Acholeplasma] multilocale]|uniref:S66 family peptidase n=1 Tax=[Acholeplasma] multilocale TaxID=264638 RepID=UPI0005598D1E|nr:S66 peptidase family protein [[Acholeplasma] multilocale]